MRYITGIGAVMVLALLSTGVHAESVSDTRVLTLEGAKTVIAAAAAEAKRVHAPGGSIAVVDAGGNLLALERLDHSFAASANIAMLALARSAVSTGRGLSIEPNFPCQDFIEIPPVIMRAIFRSCSRC